MKKALVFIAIAVVVIGVPLLSKVTQREEAKEVRVHTVKQQPIRSSILASGTLMFREQVQLRSEVIGQRPTLSPANDACDGRSWPCWPKLGMSKARRLSAGKSRQGCLWSQGRPRLLRVRSQITSQIPMRKNLLGSSAIPK